MKILFVTEKFPYPLDTGGNVRTFHLLKALAEEHEVALLATAQGEVQDSHLSEVGKLCCDIRLVRVEPQRVGQDLGSFIRSLWSSTPFLISRHFRPAVRREIIAAFQGGPAKGPRRASTIPKLPTFDVVHFNHLDAAIYATDVPAGVLQVLDEHNVVTNQVRTTLVTEQRLLRKVLLQYELARLREYEARVCSSMDRCLVCSELDVQALRDLGAQSPIAVVPNGVDLEYFTPDPLVNANDCEMIFVGTLDYDPCEKGVWYFCEEILPLIRHEIPSLRFVVVGRNPSKRLQAIADSDEAIILTGCVEDIRPYVLKAGVFVVPLLSGSGTRLKILEAMAIGIPVVSTSIGAEGIGITHGENILIADSPRDFANSVVRLLRKTPETDSIKTKARLLVEEQYGWTMIYKNILDEYKSFERTSQSLESVR